ncbi:MAG TPA: thioesterase family protein [Thermoanaerobaculia bacterium]|nr:thioesterase family protein [Thermoanaerobaculia bacterium]
MPTLPTAPFSWTFQVRWGDMDLNAHMRNTAYLDTAVDVRMMYFAAHGFPFREFEKLRLGPVVQRDELEYYRELHLLDSVTVTLELAGISLDASRFRIRNDFLRQDGTLAARLTTTGGWLDLGRRRLVAPPETLATLLSVLPRTADFEELAPALKL